MSGPAEYDMSPLPTREIELKLELPQDDQRAVKLGATPKAFSNERSTSRILHSIYFDTDTQALRRAGISLRVRKVGRDWVQTAKIGTTLHNGLATPIEIETKVPGPKPRLDAIDNPKISSRIRTLLAEQELHTAFETVMQRSTRMLRGPDGSRIEVAFDTGDIRTGTTHAPLTELELELKSGSVETLFEVAKELVKARPFRFSPCSKAERGYRLAEGRTASLPLPEQADTIKLSKSCSMEDAFRAVLRSCYSQILQNRLAVLSSPDPEAAHQLRIGLRRLRSALDIFAPGFDAETTTSISHLTSSSQSLAICAGKLRDIDALIEDIFAPLATVGALEVDFAPLRTLLEKRRLAARTRLRAELTTSQMNGFLFDLGALIEGTIELDKTAATDKPDGNSASARRFARKALDKRWTKVTKRAAAMHDMSTEERHALRKALKKLRYTTEFFGSLFSKGDVKPFNKRLKQLQNMFGYMNDVAVLQRLTNDMDLEPGTPEIERALGFALGWHQNQAGNMWQQTCDSWKVLHKSGPFWR